MNSKSNSQGILDSSVRQLEATLKIDIRDEYGEIYMYKGKRVTATKSNLWKNAWQIPYGFVVSRSDLKAIKQPR